MASEKRPQPYIDEQMSNDIDQFLPICLERIDDRTCQAAVITCGHLFCGHFIEQLRHRCVIKLKKNQTEVLNTTVQKSLP